MLTNNLQLAILTSSQRQLEVIVAQYIRHQWKDEHGKWHAKTMHRWVWEEAHGPIPLGYVIHHKDGNKKNNALDNLEMLTREEHNARHDFFGEINRSRRGRTFDEIFGLERSGEIREVLSEKSLGRVKSETTRRKLSESLMGHGVSPEARRAMSESAKIRTRGPRSEETKQKIAEAHRGFKLSDDVRKRMTEARKAKKVQNLDGGGI